MASTRDWSIGPPTAIKFLVGDRKTGKYSYAWRFGVGNTSFYIKPLLPALQGIKISLHGPDPRPELVPFYKIALEPDGAGKTDPGRQALTRRIGWPDRQKFVGHEIHPGVDLVLRLRFAHNLFDEAAISAPIPPAPHSRDAGALIPAPAAGYATDVDVLVCRQQPYWPDEDKARRDNACLGPLANKAGQYLTAVAHHRRVAGIPSPVEHKAPPPRPVAGPHDRQLRVIGAAFDPREFLWIHEMWVPTSGMHPSFSVFSRPKEA